MCVVFYKLKRCGDCPIPRFTVRGHLLWQVQRSGQRHVPGWQLPGRKDCLQLNSYIAGNDSPHTIALYNMDQCSLSNLIRLSSHIPSFSSPVNSCSCLPGTWIMISWHVKAFSIMASIAIRFLDNKLENSYPRCHSHHTKS